MRLDEIEQNLNKYNNATRKNIIKRWRALLVPELNELASRMNPFEGKRKNLFTAKPNKRNYRSVSVWGIHPNIYNDPVAYPNVPPQGFLKSKKIRIHLTELNQYRFVGRLQKHRKSVGNIFNTTPLTDFFTIRKLVMGIKKGTEKKKPAVIPVYSKRSLPEMVKDYDGLEQLIISTFEKAVKG